LLSVAGGEDLSLVEVNEAAEVIRQAATDETNIIFGATVDERLEDQVWVTVVATGLGQGRRRGSILHEVLEQPAVMRDGGADRPRTICSRWTVAAATAQTPTSPTSETSSGESLMRSDVPTAAVRP